MEAEAAVDTSYITFLVLDLGLDVLDGVAALDLERDRLACQRLHEDLHLRRGVAISGCGDGGGRSETNWWRGVMAADVVSFM
jgi:hypothetical protein